jgi:hypothetical protein
MLAEPGTNATHHHFQKPARPHAGSVWSEFPCFLLKCSPYHRCSTLLVKSTAAAGWDAPSRLDTIAEAPVTSDTEAVIL